MAVRDGKGDGEVVLMGRKRGYEGRKRMEVTLQATMQWVEGVDSGSDSVSSSRRQCCRKLGGFVHLSVCHGLGRGRVGAGRRRGDYVAPNQRTCRLKRL